MIKQRNYKKVTKFGKRRVNLFELEQRVTALEQSTRRQSRVNGHQIRVNNSTDLLLDMLEEKIDALLQRQNRTFLQWLLWKLSK
ncbi:hypothetical protein [Testudinibacter aquarius]|uniref:Uncharacterized protein n=1 Tax=Testudinibacter aquarius TaxID=1524974 RepID=A0A4R3Y9C8_9PAST|nr:hypothetical protein [Testudinibacter aquarius]KAE9526041.1 hypothetical protein A1D24_03145 [Testudinibacter aquarius]TCV87234.1 hypothetical protein EDC16_105153 [Testudinibacter aquarius]TNG91276.1 hypothetical protein FHQ21_08225 [Testudinibacter aquarius]